MNSVEAGNWCWFVNLNMLHVLLEIINKKLPEWRVTSINCSMICIQLHISIKMRREDKRIYPQGLYGGLAPWSIKWKAKYLRWSTKKMNRNTIYAIIQDPDPFRRRSVLFSTLSSTIICLTVLGTCIAWATGKISSGVIFASFCRIPTIIFSVGNVARSVKKIIIN